MQARKEVQLILDDGSRFSGYSFGYDKPVAGEVVFNTAMTGYPESLTDPSYSGQMMVLTFPLVGNYGVPRQTFEANGLSTFLESEKIHAEAIIVSDYSENYSHWNAVESLGEWLKKEKIDTKMSDEEYDKRAAEIKDSKTAPIVIIKATDDATYKNLIDALDEMHICSINRYAIVDIAEGDEWLVENYEKKGELTNQIDRDQMQQQ